jgi:hypothetical protein
MRRSSRLFAPLAWLADGIHVSSLKTPLIPMDKHRARLGF